MTAEHLVLAEDTILDDLCLLINKIFKAGHVTDSMKLGLVTPVFKKKGSNTDFKNYRGITVIPILTKPLEIIVRSRIKPLDTRKPKQSATGFHREFLPYEHSPDPRGIQT